MKTDFISFKSLKESQFMHFVIKYLGRYWLTNANVVGKPILESCIMVPWRRCQDWIGLNGWSYVIPTAEWIAKVSKYCTTELTHNSGQ